jgi:predicted Zn finger-like uncharacterized protein
MHIDCHGCHARYHMDLALFKGAKGIRFRCRKCGNSLDVSNPAGIGSDRNVVNDTSFSRDPSDNSGIEPACLPQEDGEDEESGEENWRKTLLVLAETHAPLPKSPAKAWWSSLIVPFLFLLLFACGSTYFIFTKGGNGMLSGIGQNLADTVTFLRS